MSTKIAPLTKFIFPDFLFIKKVGLDILLRNLVLSSSLVLFPFQMHLGSPNILTNNPDNRWLAASTVMSIKPGRIGKRTILYQFIRILLMRVRFHSYWGYILYINATVQSTNQLSGTTIRVPVFRSVLLIKRLLHDCSVYIFVYHRSTWVFWASTKWDKDRRG